MTRKPTSQSRILSVALIVACLLATNAFAVPAHRAGADKPSIPVRFEPAVTYGSGGYIAQGVAIADLNGDGVPDIVVENWWNPNDLHGAVDVLLGNGDGTFRPAVTYETAGAPNYSVVLADVNGDGKIDIIVASCAPNSGTCGSSDGVVSVLLGNGNGTFQTAVSYDSGAATGVGLAVADVNGDGKPDLIVTNYGGESNGDGAVAVLLGNGNGTFRPAALYDSGAQDANGLTVADLNGDGIPDILVANRCVSCSGGVLSILFGNGNGTFQPAVIYPTGGNEAGWVKVADINGDGIPDIIVANENLFLPNGSVAVFIGTGGGKFKPAVTYSSGGYAAVELSIDDMNGDGNPDVVVADCGPVDGCYLGTIGQIGVLLGNGDGTFLPVTTYSSGAYNATALAVADLTGRGELDIVAGNQCEVNNCALGSVAVLINNSGPCGGKCATSTSFTSSLNPAIYGQSVTFTATVTTTGGSIPTGTVVFSWGGGLWTATLNSSGVAVLTRPYLNAGSFLFTAVYKGDANNLGSTSAVLNQVVESATSAATITSSANPSTVGEAVTFTAKITSPAVRPKGPVRFTAGTTVLGTVELSGGKATLTTSSLPAGSNAVMVTYGGSSDIAKSSATVTQVVQP